MVEKKLFFLFREDVDHLAQDDFAVIAGRPLVAIFHEAIDHGKKGIVDAFLDVVAREISGAALANNDVSGFGVAAIADFNTQTLGSGVAAQSGYAAGFFMSHI